MHLRYLRHRVTTENTKRSGHLLSVTTGVILSSYNTIRGIALSSILGCHGAESPSHVGCYFYISFSLFSKLFPILSEYFYKLFTCTLFVKFVILIYANSSLILHKNPVTHFLAYGELTTIFLTLSLSKYIEKFNFFHSSSYSFFISQTLTFNKATPFLSFLVQHSGCFSLVLPPPPSMLLLSWQKNSCFFQTFSGYILTQFCLSFIILHSARVLRSYLNFLNPLSILPR